MTYSTSCSNRALGALAVFALLLAAVSGCGPSARGGKALAGRETAPPPEKETLVALLPVENLSGSKAPLEALEEALAARLAARGFRLLDREILAGVMSRHRIRYTGGVSSDVAQALREEAGAGLVFITTLEAYREANPPKISLLARLVRNDRRPEILWMDSVGMTGEDAPGLLGLGRIRSSGRLLDLAVEKLVSSLAGPGGRDLKSGRRAERAKGKYRPRLLFRSPVFDPQARYTVAVVPFLNLSARKHAGLIVTEHFVKQLTRLEGFRVTEPGLVRAELLRYRAVMEAGPSLAVADTLFSDDSLEVDLVLSGKVFDYQGEAGRPQVDFSMQIIEKKSREIIGAARSHATGDQGVYFFGIGEVHSAHDLTEDLARACLAAMVEKVQ